MIAESNLVACKNTPNRAGWTQKIAEDSKARNKLSLCKYSSVGKHIGAILSRKDDLESLGYILLYFLRGGFLFRGLNRNSNHSEKIKQYENQKLKLVPEEDKKIPLELCTYFNYVRMLKYSDMPDYDYLKDLFGSVFRRQKSIYYDWILHFSTEHTKRSKSTKNSPDGDNPQHKISTFAASHKVDQGHSPQELGDQGKEELDGFKEEEEDYHKREGTLEEEENKKSEKIIELGVHSEEDDDDNKGSEDQKNKWVEDSMDFDQKIDEWGDDGSNVSGKMNSMMTTEKKFMPVVVYFK